MIKLTRSKKDNKKTTIFYLTCLFFFLFSVSISYAYQEGVKKFDPIVG